MFNDRTDSPFFPGDPLPADYFIGRTPLIQDLIHRIRQAQSGRAQHVFLTGDRGIGKSSLAAFVRHFAVSKHDFIGIHVFLGGVTTVEELVRKVFDELVRQTQGNRWFDKIAHFFGDNIREIGLFGVNVQFSPSKQDLAHLVNRFPDALSNILDQINEEKRGIFVALDDINGLADKREFADWYKSFVDEVATRFSRFPVVTMVIGLPERREKLSTLQPSLMRIFRVVEMERLSNDEVTEFVQKAFERVSLSIDHDALHSISVFSSGLPVIMHEIGDATYWLNDDDVIDKEDAHQGVLAAADQVGKKYLTPKVSSAIRSNAYRTILRRLGTALSRPHFTRKDVAGHFSGKELRVFDNFLQRMRQLGIIEQDPEGGRGAYRFASDIYLIYVWLESQRAQGKVKVRRKSK